MEFLHKTLPEKVKRVRERLFLASASGMVFVIMILLSIFILTIIIVYIINRKQIRIRWVVVSKLLCKFF